MLVGQLDEMYWGNCLIGGLIGMLLIDPATGAMYKLQENIWVNLTPENPPAQNF